MKVIFLDVDGPINTDLNIIYHRSNGMSASSNYIILPRENLLNLKYIISRTHAKIVLSSSWRKDSKAIMNLSNQLYEYNMRIYDYTPIDKYGVRGLECKQWLETFNLKRGYYPKYVIIDDKTQDIVNYHRGHCITVCTKYGLTRELADIAINILNKPYGYKLEKA